VPDLVPSGGSLVPTGGGEVPTAFSQRRPRLDSLYDVFANVRDDEREHWKTLCNLVQFDDMQGIESTLVVSTKPRPASAGAS
jgi:ubiquinol oxidase